MNPMIEQLRALTAAAAAKHAARPPARPGAAAIVAEEIGGIFGAPPAEFIRAEDRLREDLGLDGLDLTALALALERRLGLPAALDMSGLARVADVVRAVGGQ